jgi:glucosamine--fructose-6-phosphate aminotransferase (isomerizing)
MCGVVEYIGKNNGVPIIIECLKNLEYRGYDSAGIAVINEKKLKIIKKQGKVADLEKAILEGGRSYIGIGHTRWATHGVPSEENAHPHQDCTGKIAVVHNGIIENYLSLKDMLISEGHKFKSDTDSEVIAHLVEKYYSDDIYKAVKESIKLMDGSYAIAVLHSDHPNQIIATKNKSPLILGLGKNENFIASDVPAILKYTNDIIFLEDGDLCQIFNKNIVIRNSNDKIIDRPVKKIDWNYEMAQKNGYDNFMLKEIFEQPRAIQETIISRISEDKGKVYFKEINLSDEKIRNIKRIVIVSCGTSWHAGLIGKIFIEKMARIPVTVEYASEFRYSEPIINENTLVIGISQSGETADTLAAMNEAKKYKSSIISICNVVGSSIARISDGVIYTHAGPEIGVASTKAFTTQLVVLYFFSVFLARINRNISIPQAIIRMKGIRNLQREVDNVLKLNSQIKKLAEIFYKKKNILYIGRGVGFAIALEGALKLKEISYIHAEGYHAGEMKHGPIALIDKNMPVVVIALKGRRYNKIMNNIEEIKSRHGVVIAIVTEGDERIKKIADYTIPIPDVNEFLSTVLSIIPLQLFAYHIAIKKGCNVDQPRNLAKSVTVE